MPIDVDQTQVDAVTTDVMASFDVAMTAINDRPKPWQSVVTALSSSTDSELHDFFEHIGHMRELPFGGEKIVDQMRERKYLVQNRDYYKGIRLHKNRVADRQAGSAGVNIGTRLAALGADNDDKLVWDAFALAATTLTSYTGDPLISGTHTVGSDALDNDGGGAGDRFYLISMQYGVGPVILQRRESYAVTALDRLTDPEVVKRKELQYYVDGRLVVAAGLPQTIWSSAETLDSAELNVGIQAMAGFTDGHGDSLGIVPNILLVGKSNWKAGRDLIDASLVGGGNTNTDAGSATGIRLVYAPRLP